MKAPTLRALAWDALFQVLDNSVFRILAVITLLPVLFTFLVGFREDEVIFLFGLKSWSYEGLLELFGGVAGTVEDAQGYIIEVFLSIVFDQLVGTFGVLFCIAATAFFVPRMIEKGAADVLFHKPVARLTLYLSRFLAGLIFVGILSVVLVVGAYMGILLVSGRNDPGILFAALSLTYLFGLIYAVCMLIGVVTRSTVASILITVLFFGFNGCIHTTWISLQQLERSANIDLPAGDAEEEDAEVEEDEDDDEPGTLKRVFLTTLDTLHYTLPKTTDADYIARKLRRAVDAPVFKDEDTLFTVFRQPDGTMIIEAGELRPELAPAELRDALGQPIFGLRAVADGSEATYTVWRRPAETTESERNGRTRVRRETSRAAAERLEEGLGQLALRGAPIRESTTFGANAKGMPAAATLLRWTEETSDGVRTRGAFLFRGTEWSWFHTLLIDAPGELDTEAWTETVRRIDRTAGLDANLLRKANWYEEELRVDAELKYNMIFSIGSSLVFVLVLLLIGGWRLNRIEF